MGIIKSGFSDDHLSIDAVTPYNLARTTQYAAVGEHRSTFATFMVGGGNFAPPASAQSDLIVIIGSPSKVVRVISFLVGTTNTGAGSQQFFLLKRSSLNTGGTFVTPAILSANVALGAPTATVGHYTAAPTTLGNSLGNINIVRWASPTAVPGFAVAAGGIARDASKEILPPVPQFAPYKLITLRGPNQMLCMNFNGATPVTGQNHVYRIVWSESDT